MLKGINGQPYINMEPHLDMETFDKFQPEIYKGFAVAREHAKEGTWMAPGFTFDDMSYVHNWKPIYKAMEEFLALPEDNPIKKEGMKLMPKDFKNFQERNLFTRYLKMAMGAYDPYIYYYLWEEGNWDDRPGERQLTPESYHFPSVVEWVLKLKGSVFEHIGRVIFFHCEHDGIPFEHRDLDAKNGVNVVVPHRNEFIHIRPDTRNQFYLWDPEKKMKYGINCRAAWWNDTDWHGGNRVMAQTYGLRIDGKFTEEFRKKIGVDHLDSY
ncbi:MAG: hypothetical protein RLZZ196_3457 [Bacteroidota bacterium]|jgi:hypothetical protein